MNTLNKKIFLGFPRFFYSYDTIIKSGFSYFSNKMRLGSDWNFDSIEERVNLFISGSKTSSSRSRLGSFKLFLIIKKR